MPPGQNTCYACWRANENLDENTEAFYRKGLGCEAGSQLAVATTSTAPRRQAPEQPEERQQRPRVEAPSSSSDRPSSAGAAAGSGRESGPPAGGFSFATGDRTGGVDQAAAAFTKNLQAIREYEKKARGRFGCTGHAQRFDSEGTYRERMRSLGVWRDLRAMLVAGIHVDQSLRAAGSALPAMPSSLDEDDAERLDRALSGQLIDLYAPRTDKGPDYRVGPVTQRYIDATGGPAGGSGATPGRPAAEGKGKGKEKNKGKGKDKGKQKGADRSGAAEPYPRWQPRDRRY